MSIHMPINIQEPQNPIWFDAHCHLTDPRISENLSAILERSLKVGVKGWIQGGISPDEWKRQIQLRQNFGTGILMTFGLHPIWVAQQTPAGLEKGLQQLATQATRAQGLGEIGLDHGPRMLRESFEIQRIAAEKQLELARDFEKPMVLHVVQAHGEMLQLLKKWGPFKRGGLVHSFSGSIETARDYIRLGFFISIGGSITRDGYSKLKKTFPSLPLDHLLIETDSPDQTPQLPVIHRQEINEPAHLIPIARFLAELRGIAPEELLDRSTTRLRQLFGIF